MLTIEQIVKELTHRPRLLRQLAEALGEVGLSIGERTGSQPDNLSAERQCEWLTPRQVGEKLGMSAQWVRDRLEFLPPSAIKRKETGRRETFVNYTTTKDIFINYKIR